MRRVVEGISWDRYGGDREDWSSSTSTGLGYTVGVAGINAKEGLFKRPDIRLLDVNL